MNSTRTNKGHAIVTGANGGMGKEICKSLLSAGYTLTMVCRPRKAKCPFYDYLLQQYGPQRVTKAEMDLASTESIRHAASQIVGNNKPVDILINNAGMMGWKPETTAEGYEIHSMVNCMGPMLFTRLLLPVFHKGTRIVNTVSVTIWIGKYRDSFPYSSGKFNRFKYYSDSKLILQLLSLRLAKEWEEKGITVNTSDPGIVNTPIIQLHNWLDPISDAIYRPLIRTPQKGAETTVFLALDQSVKGKTGALYKNCKPKKLKRIAHHPAISKAWDTFESLFAPII